MTGPAPQPSVSPPPPPVSAPGPSGVKTVLLLSLAFNVLLVGLLAGSFLRGHWRNGPGPDVGFGPLTRALSPEDRRALFKGFMERGKDFRADRQEMRADVDALAQSLRADPWDRAVTEEILARIGARGEARVAAGRAVLLDHLATMTAEARGAFADRIEAALKRKGKDGDGKVDKDRG